MGGPRFVAAVCESLSKRNVSGALNKSEFPDISASLRLCFSALKFPALAPSCSLFEQMVIILSPSMAILGRFRPFS